jgi:hypothetical protein
LKPSDKRFGIIKGDETAIDALLKAIARSASSNLELIEVAAMEQSLAVHYKVAHGTENSLHQSRQ